MRHLTIAMLLLTGGILSAHGAVLSFSFSGTWGGSLGVIQTGDTFAGVATWDTASLAPAGSCSFPNCMTAPLLSLTFTMPAADGLSIASLSNSQVKFADVLYANTPNNFGYIQLNDKSGTDGNIYSFFLASSSAKAANAGLTVTINATGFTVAGPSTIPGVPEPRTSLLAATGLALALVPVAYRRRRALTGRARGGGRTSLRRQPQCERDW